MNPVYLIYFVLIVIGLIILWAFIRCFFKRLSCWAAVRNVCRKCGFTLQAKPFWFLGSRYLKGVDFVIEAPSCTFAVKLFGCLWPLKSLILREYGEYCFRAHANFLKFILDLLDGYPHPIPAYRFPEPGDKPQQRFLLINPMPLEILMQPNNGQEQISGTGDRICGMELANLSHLLRIVESAK
ncbi:MAG: hypothetical protein IKL25_07040 [Clostridia bacterium]|nr:hypothetical protein [Clostridia bacterium]